MTRVRQKALRDPRVLIIDDLELDEELDTGGEVGEVSQSISDRAVCGDGSTEVETVPLPSGKHGWKRNSHLRLPVGFLPPEWRGRRVRVTFEVEPGRRPAQNEDWDESCMLHAVLRPEEGPPEQRPRRQRCPGSGKTVRLQGLQIASRKAPCPECQALRSIVPQPDRTAVLPTHMREVTSHDV